MLLSTVVLIMHQSIRTTVAFVPTIRPIGGRQTNVLLQQTRDKLAPIGDAAAQAAIHPPILDCWDSTTPVHYPMYFGIYILKAL
jgi:hypothetical protein